MHRALPLMVTIALLAPIPAPAQDSAAGAQVKRGEYLVSIAGCHDCHTPWMMGSAGPEPDMKRALSGHPQDLAISAPATLSAPWNGAMNPTSTAWSGPWGVSFSANLTSDPETGVLRDFTEQQFIQTIRTGRHQGQGRQILPPMPWPAYANMTDDDLKAVFAYLRQVPPVKNKVPDPLPSKP
ncbi:c-type cytochrome [Microvirga splendida]|uniref:Diheme cytochrome c-553 n=1 Tax=Microvirga splendida TaxID=2795727 RepID=A0ABS0Y2A9_9HYPH|nr:diheme cytochrome c-553 [Microvirga splendida]MBJ6126409.1 diheme cytochrome c-553 [Microvirga splendida]